MPTMEVNEEHVHTLLSMGFPSESEIRKALRLGKNDLNEAVAYLTNETSVSGIDTLDDIDVEMKDMHRGSGGQAEQMVYGPVNAPPPSYDEVVPYVESDHTLLKKATEVSDESEVTNGHNMSSDSTSFEFPVTNLYELEGRVFTDHWSIPYKKEESLGKCLFAATRLAKEGLCDADDNCVRFLDRCMPECFQKLLTAGAVHRWGTDIQEGVYTMLQLLVDLVAARLLHKPVPIGLLNVLSMAFNPDTEFHFKNKNRRGDRSWEDKLGVDKMFGVTPTGSMHKDPFGWLTDLINRFAFRDGFDCISQALKDPDLDAPSISALLQPFGQCVDFLNPKVVEPMLAPGMEGAVRFVQDLKENDLKEKKVGSVSDLLATMKTLCLALWPQEVKPIDQLRLEVALRMLKSPHFNARMNSLKEVDKLIELSMGTKPPKVAIPQDVIQDWLVQNGVLSIALEGNIDQAQYCDKVKGILDFLGTGLSLDELTKIWKMRNGQTNHVIDNIHLIISAGAVRFNSEQLEHLFWLIQKSWAEENDKMREKLLSLIGKIGKDAKVQKTTTRVCELLWDLAHLPALPTHLIELALEEHLVILSDSYSIKEQVKKFYVIKCIEDIKKGVWVLPALRQLLHIAKNISKNTLHKAEKGILQELNRGHDIIKLISSSLVKCHKQAAAAAEEGGLNPDVLVDGRYTHGEYVSIHLSFLQFVLKDLYLPWNRAREIWLTLVKNPDACEWDIETGFDWFTRGISDLDSETQRQMFQKELMTLNPSTLSMQGFRCFNCFFESVNLNANNEVPRLKKIGSTLTVERLDLMGLDYLWEICLNSTNEEIGGSAINLLLNMSYVNLAARLKKDLVSLHKKFINELYNRLEAAMMTLRGSAVAQAISSATRMITAPTVPEALAVPSASKSAKLLNIERLLLVAEMYVSTVEETHTTSRTILPHGASFHGEPIKLNITCDSPKMEFTVQTHSNESLGQVREKVAAELKSNVEQVQMVANEKVLIHGKEQKLLYQMDIFDNMTIQAKVFSSSVSQSTPSKEAVGSASARESFDLEQEKMLPGVVMALEGQVFEMLYHLADMDEPKITERVRNLLQLIPTDPYVQDSLDSIGHKGIRQPSTDEATPSPKPSPRASPRLSPRKSLASPSSPSLSGPRFPSPRDGLKALLDAHGQDMSAFKVLYNLEVLSSKLLPIAQDTVTQECASSFCEDFLNIGGLNLVINILQKDAIPMEVDYQTRQGCYAICLQLARYLLCGHEIGEKEPTLTGRSRRMSICSVSGATTGLTIEPTAATRVIQTMSVENFKETVACLIRVTWAAAAGRLHLASSSAPIRENNMYGGTRSRQSSTGSTASNSSDPENQALHAGICVTQKEQLSHQDCLIAKEALEILVTCLQLRSSLIASFYSITCVSDFIIDILVGCPRDDIRQATYEQLFTLSQVDLENSEVMSPHQFILQVLLKARLPFWITASIARSGNQKLLRQCTEYFDLRCQLLVSMSIDVQKKYQLDIPTALEDEIAWLNNFVTSMRTKDIDNVLLAGHLRLVQTLLTCEGMEKKVYGQTLVPMLLDEFLFPASKLILDGLENMQCDRPMHDFEPKCSGLDSRVAAYQLLTEVASGCLDNLQLISKSLLYRHHQVNPDCANEWEGQKHKRFDYMPPVDSRAACGYVGLKNGGATCYMNSVLQQLFMHPGVAEYILGVEMENVDEESVFYQIQMVLGHLLESCLQYHVPEKFWKVFKLWGQTVNIREQQDALDFFQAIVDQIDDTLKGQGKDQVFKKKFQGVYSDQKICKDCPHRYEREEEFYALNLTVKNATLQDSLDQFVKGELLEGDNAYFCEKCGEKRNTIKRMCIKTLPPVLCIQLKRFGYDWEMNRALKFDDYFRFPWVLDMEPYTEEGMAWREHESQSEESSDEGSEVILTPGAKATRQINYELVGIVVHSGQANAGHYYSFIKDRKGNSKQGVKWLKFNDTIVEEFEMTDAALEAECFGGTYKANVYEQSSSSYPEDRLRYWNGYLLFYERMEDTRAPVSAKKSRVTTVIRDNEPISASQTSDSFVELTELVHKGEKKGIFMDRMPAHIQQVVRGENLIFMKNRDIYDVEYFTFIRELCAANMSWGQHEKFADMSVESLQLCMFFLFNTYFRTKKKLRSDCDNWVSNIETLLHRCKAACMWLVEFLAIGHGRPYIKPFLLECPHREIRQSFEKILETMMASFFHHGGVTTHKCFDELLEVLLHMLNKDVPDNIKTCTQYFSALSSYVLMGTKACCHMFGRNAFPRLMSFLLGPIVISQTPDQEVYSRRWSSLQARDFGPLHTVLATLILNSDVSKYRTDDPKDHPIKMPSTVTPQIYLKMSTEMHKCVFGPDSSRYIREVVFAIREVTTSTAALTDMLLYCGFCNKQFSMEVLKQIMFQYMNSPSNELKNIFTLLMDFVLLEDPLQLQRLQCVIEGFTDENDFSHQGMLDVIRSNNTSDSRRSYQCIKFLVHIANKCTLAKDYLLQTPNRWQWAVNWLKDKMSERYWHQASAASNEDSNSKSFQRTMSAQYTLEEARALLTEIDYHEPDMEVGQGDQATTAKKEPDVIPKPSTSKSTSRDDLDKVD
ncbi:ubiquitin carboxyl-terminal hydrolase 24-like isoform X2 [Lineus longissimus]|uniref:ubiquitin carboxyl-terminal hydrolase 24-like isoform X2 n=1 Tax=Lineus longissimus TaxID=88925 RepID=UPI00315D18F8